MHTTTRSLLLLICITCSAMPAVAMQTLQEAPTSPVGTTVQGVDVARDTLDSYVGTYVINPGFEVRVWRDDQRLMLQATGQEAWPLVAESESVFTVPAMDARISFGRDARGRADHLVIQADGQETHALRR